MVILGCLLSLAAYTSYWFLGRQAQNRLLLLASAAVCVACDVRSALWLFGSTALEFALCSRLAREQARARRAAWLWASVALDAGTLIWFRYAGPFSSVGHARFGGAAELPALLIAAPIGVSFYTLQRLSYVLDVYREVQPPPQNLADFALFCGFFPQLLAGPIERAKNVVPQFERRRPFELERWYRAWWLVALGAFEKFFLADGAGELSNQLSSSAHPGTVSAAFGVYAYALQIYADFAGYSSMARGVAALLGIDLMQNFRGPYLSANIAEYWQRWHISLSSWLDDYVFQPCALRLRRAPTAAILVATWVTFLVSAAWHGVGLTFLAWGAVHASALTLFSLTRRWRKKLGRRAPATILRPLSVFLTFHWVCLGYIFFRAPRLAEARATLAQLGHWAVLDGKDSARVSHVVAYGVLVFALQFLELKHRDEFWVFQYPTWVRAACYAGVLFCVVRLSGSAGRFMYAQF